MSFSNLAWYGWICFALSISSTMMVLRDLILVAKGTKVANFAPLIPAVFIALTLYQLLP